MNKENEHLENLSEIRSIMERSSRFISLSGLSGVFTGMFALTGTIAAYVYFDLDITSAGYYEFARRAEGEINMDFYRFLLTDALCVLVASLAVACILTVRKAKKEKLPIWDGTAKRLFLNMFIPLVAGGLFCLVLLWHDLVYLVAPATMIFYGLALLNASKYSLNDIRYLGIMQIVLGLMASVFIGFGLLLWATGFGILHIVYGIVMYRKYER